MDPEATSLDLDEEQCVVVCEAYRDDAGSDPLPRLIGPFASRDQAAAHMDSLGPLWGSWNVSPIATPARLAAQPPATDRDTALGRVAKAAVEPVEGRSEAEAGVVAAGSLV